MVQTLQAENITLRQLIDFYGLQFVDDRSFFAEWQEALPELSELDMQLLDQIKAGYLNGQPEEAPFPRSNSVGTGRL